MCTPFSETQFSDIIEMANLSELMTGSQITKCYLIDLIPEKVKVVFPAFFFSAAITHDEKV